MGKRRRAPGPASPEPRQPAPGVRASAGQVCVLVAMVLVIGLSGGYLIVRFGGTGGSPAPAAADPAAIWRVRLSQNPQDVEAMLGLAHVHLDRQELDAAEPFYRQVLAREARNVEAITHLGTIALARGRVETALRQYEAALAIQPDYVHALWDTAVLLQQVTRDYPAAIRAWERFQRAVGPQSADAKTAQGFIREARQAMAAESPVEKAFGGRP